MKPIFALILGLFIGWIAEWIIDWAYWRRRYQELQEAAAQSEQKRASVEAELLSARRDVHSLQEKSGRFELEKIHNKSGSLLNQQELDATHAQPAISQPIVPDNLEEIKGIGPVIAKMLNKNGIFTFDQLSALTPEFLRSILGDVIQRLSNEESLIEQAHQFAQRKIDKGTGVK